MPDYVMKLIGGVPTRVQVQAEVKALGWGSVPGDVNRQYLESSPSFETFRGSTKGWAYGVGEQGTTTFRIPHDYKQETDLYLLLYWSHNASSITGTLEVQFALTYAKGLDHVGFSEEIYQSIKVPELTIEENPPYSNEIDEVQISIKGGLIPVSSELYTGTGSSTLVSRENTWDPGDKGKTLLLRGAGFNGGDLRAKVLQVLSAREVLLSLNTSTSKTLSGFEWVLLPTESLEPNGLIIVDFEVMRVPLLSGGTSSKPFLWGLDLQYQTDGERSRERITNLSSPRNSTR